MTWAASQKIGRVNDKMVLVMLANHHNGITGLCNPSLKTLAESSCISRDSVIRSIRNLEKMGLVTVERRRIESINLPNNYRLNVVADSGHGGSTQRLGVVAHSNQGSSSVQPESGSESISLSSLNDDEKKAYEWAQTEPFWADRIKGDIAKFRHFYANGKLREQFAQWQAKQTQGQKNGKRKTDSGVGRKLSAVERVRQACGIAEEFENQSVVSHQ